MTGAEQWIYFAKSSKLAEKLNKYKKNPNKPPKATVNSHPSPQSSQQDPCKFHQVRLTQLIHTKKKKK